MNHSELRFPVDEAYLARVTISPAKYAAWKAEAIKQVLDAVQDVNSWYFRGDIYSKAFKMIADRKGLKGYLKKKQDKGSKKHFYCQANLDLTLEDIMYGIHCEKTFEQRSINAHLYNETFLDGAVLDVHETNTFKDPFQFVGMKWLAVNPPAAGLLSPRDYIFFEYSGTTTDAEGRKVLFQFVETKILDPSKEIRENDFGFSRGNIFMLNLYRTEKESVHAACVGSFMPSGNIPNWVAIKGVQIQMSSIVNIGGLADARAVVATGLMKSIVSPKKHHYHPKDCIVCKRKFNFVRLKHTCRACGEITCRHCVVTLKFYNQQSNYSASTLPVVSEKFCLCCVLYARKERNSLKRPQLTPPSASSTPPPQVSKPESIPERKQNVAVDTPKSTTKNEVDLCSSTADTVMGSFLANSLSLESTSELRFSSLLSADINTSSSYRDDMSFGRKRSLSWHTNRCSVLTVGTSTEWSEHLVPEEEEENDDFLFNRPLRASVCGHSDELLMQVSSRVSLEDDFEFLTAVAARKMTMDDLPAASKKSSAKDKKMVLLDLDDQAQLSKSMSVPSSKATPAPANATTTTSCFDDLAKSIAMQNSLLQSIQRERERLYHQQQMRYGLTRSHCAMGRRRDSVRSSRTSAFVHDSNRFEVLS